MRRQCEHGGEAQPTSRWQLLLAVSVVRCSWRMTPNRRVAITHHRETRVGWIGRRRVVQEKRLDGVAGGSEAAGDRCGRGAADADEFVDLAQVDAGEVRSGQVQAVEDLGRRLPVRNESG